MLARGANGSSSSGSQSSNGSDTAKGGRHSSSAMRPGRRARVERMAPQSQQREQQHSSSSKRAPVVKKGTKWPAAAATAALQPLPKSPELYSLQDLGYLHGHRHTHTLMNTDTHRSLPCRQPSPVMRMRHPMAQGSVRSDTPQNPHLPTVMNLCLLHAPQAVVSTLL